MKRTVLAWITAGLPFERVEVLDRWMEGHINVVLAMVPDGRLCCLGDFHGTLYLLAALNDGVMWPQRRTLSSDRGAPNE